MTPEQMAYFMDSVWDLLECTYVGRVIDGKLVRLRDAEFRSAMMFLACAIADNGYVNMTHEEGRFVCQTESKDTVRAHLWRLALTGIMKDKCLNGTTRVKFARFPGRELVTSRDTTDLEEVLTASTEVLTASTEVLTEDPEIVAARAVYQQFRAVYQQFSAVRQHPSRNFTQTKPSKLVSKLDPPPVNSSPNLLPATTNPVEQALTVSFLVSAGFWPKTAKDLANRFGFDLLRQAVGFWWCNRRSRGGEFAEKPGIVLTWLENLDNTTIPPLSAEFMASDLYLNHRRKSEMVTATDDIEESDEEAGATSSEWPERIEHWAVALERMRESLPSGTFNTWLEGSVAEFDDQRNTCTVIVDSLTKRDYLQANLRQMITREVSRSTNHKLTVSIEARRRR